MDSFPPQVVRIGAAALALTLAVAGPSTAQSARDRALTAIRIGNFGQVDANFFRGAQPEPSDYRALAAFGVKTVIDLRNDFVREEQALVEGAGMKYQRIPMDEDERPAEASVKSFLDIVNDPGNLPVYVHCKGGRHRTGVMTAVYRLTHDNWTADRAYDEMKAFNFKVPMNFLFGHDELKDFVFDYYQMLHAAPAAAGGRF